MEYRYQDINWTTGDASGGRHGLGGIAARAGWTAGDGVDFLELAASGNLKAMLSLENTLSVDQAGIYRFKVNNGQFEDQAFAPGMSLNSFHPRLFNDRLFAGKTWSGKNGCHTRNQAATFC